MQTRAQLLNSLASLLAERDVMKRRNHEISVKLKRIRAALARTPDAGDEPASVTPQVTDDPFAMLDNILND